MGFAIRAVSVRSFFHPVAAGPFAADIFDEAFILELFENTVNRCLGDTAVLLDFSS